MRSIDTQVLIQASLFPVSAVEPVRAETEIPDLKTGQREQGNGRKSPAFYGQVIAPRRTLLPGDHINLLILKPHPEAMRPRVDPVDDLIGEKQALAHLHRGDMMGPAITGTFADGDNLIVGHIVTSDPLARAS